MLLAVLVLAATVRAIVESEVGVLDWHKSHIGVPVSAPVFHDGLVLAATDNNVLAALHPSNGSIAWRHLFDQGDRLLHFHERPTAVATLSGPGGSMLRSFDASTGDLLVEKRLHPPAEGLLTEGNAGTDVAFVNDDILALTSGHTLTLVDGASGDQKWFWLSPDQGSSVLNLRVVSTTETVYLVGLAKSFASSTLHLTSLTPSGKAIVARNIPSAIADASDLTLIRTPSHTRVVWRETDNAIHSILLSPNLDETPVAIKDGEYGRILDVGLEGTIVAKTLDDAARVLSLDSSGSLVVNWEFPGSIPGSTYAGGLDSDGEAYVARVFWSTLSSAIAVDVYAGGRDALPRYTFPFDADDNGIIHHVALSPAQPMRLVLATSSGDLQLWETDELRWTREESLSATVVAEIVDVPEERLAADANDESFLERIARQTFDARDLPRYLASLLTRFTRFTSPANAEAANAAYDVPGSRKVVVAATRFGTLFGLDAGSGAVLWRRTLGLGWAAEVGGSIMPVKLFALDGKVLLVTQRRADNSLIDTVVFHLDPLTGLSVLDGSKPGVALEGTDVISGPLIEAYALNAVSPPVVVLVDEFLQANVYPDTAKHANAFEAGMNAFHVPLLTSIVANGHARLTGHQFVKDAQLSPKAVLYPTWTFTPPRGERVVRVVRASKGRAAQVGTVVGNRKTWYRYLNPRAFGVITAVDGACGVYLVDGAKGTVLYRVRVPGGCESVRMSFAGNWLVYAYFDAGETKGQKVISVELFEGPPDAKRSSSDASAYSNATGSIQISERAFAFGERIVALAHTETAYGITVRDVLVATRAGSIRTLSRKWLNARRPFRDDPAREEEGGEEELAAYEPALPADPRLTLSHRYVVAGTERIASAPARLESTSLAFAYGLDFFFARTAPSGTFDVLSAGFNKAQLVLTIAGLAVAIGVAGPIVGRRALRERWYQ